MAGEFSVCQFFDTDNNRYEYMRRYVSAEEAALAFKHYTTCVAARMGMTKRVIITDGDDCTCMEWIYKKGITFPSPEVMHDEFMLKKKAFQAKLDAAREKPKEPK